MSDECCKCHQPTQGHVLVNNDGLCNLCYEDLSKKVMQDVIKNLTDKPVFFPKPGVK